ncbi:hypothetical protein OS493_001319 [Desmophyllum pertusum]|uniref:Uncharacterized protein n=1 Tax=Desmophyllum pertusum TaxID=174260 RepID=A0A9W9ZU70_9CNID|nr:hypothetical protein OS493_001319 [Desmophyllum pertusum]
MSATFGRLKSVLESVEERRFATEKFETLEHENSDAVRKINKRILELKQNKEDSISRASSSSRSSRRSGSSVLEKKTEMAAKVARLAAELKFGDIEAQKTAALQEHETEMKKFQITKDLAVAKAEMEAITKVHEAEIGANGEVLDLPNGKENHLQNYLSANVTSSHARRSCCDNRSTYNSICKHSLCVSEIEGILKEHLDYIAKSPRCSLPSKSGLVEPAKDAQGKKVEPIKMHGGQAEVLLSRNIH